MPANWPPVTNYHPSVTLPSKSGVSRMTARQALGYLVNEGLLEVRQGVGTFVTPPKLTHNAIHLVGFTEEMQGQGGAVASLVIEQTVVIPPVRVARRLALLPDAVAIKITRLRQVDEIPLLLETSYLPARLCPGLEQVDLTQHSLYRLLEERYQLHPYRTTESVEATVADQYEQRLLAVPNGGNAPAEKGSRIATRKLRLNILRPSTAATALSLRWKVNARQIMVISRHPLGWCDGESGLAYHFAK